MLTTLEKKERIEYYKENGKEEYVKKYKCKPSSAESCIFHYKKVLGIKTCTKQMMRGEIKEMLKYYKENGKEKTCKKYNIDDDALYSKIYYAKTIFNINCKRMEDITISKEKKLEIVMYYKTHSSIETAKKYGYKNAHSLVRSVNAWATLLGIPKPLKRAFNFNGLTDMQKRERVDDYLKYGIKYVREKYGYAEQYATVIKGYAKQLGIYIPICKNFYTRKDKKEMIRYYAENGKEAFTKKYRMQAGNVERFKHSIKADTNMDI